eukprot:gene9607-19972_t
MYDDEIERTLCQLPSCHVFKIPVLKSADGHRAADWPKDAVWTGKLKIVERGRNAFILLLDDKNQLFAKCSVEEGSVERTLDSGRYFVLRIENAQGRHAFIGIAFNERNDAFDFNVALQEHKSSLERESKAAEFMDTELPVGPMKDLSIKDGEKIKINISGVPSRREKKVTGGNTGTGGALLAPPPERTAKLTPPVPGSARRVPAAAAATSVDMFSSFSTPAQNSNQTHTIPATSTATSTTSLLDDFNSFSQPLTSHTAATTSSSTSSSTSSFGLDFDFSTPTPPVSSRDPFSAMSDTVFGSATASASATGRSTTPALDAFGFPIHNPSPPTTTTTTTNNNNSIHASSFSTTAAVQVDPFGFPVASKPTVSSSTSTSTSSAGDSLLDFNF